MRLASLLFLLFAATACGPTRASCNVGNCTGCCDQNDTCVTGDAQGQCGRAGDRCGVCPMSKVCRDGACRAPTTACGPTNCAGCCENGACVAGTSSLACGTNGMDCVVCVQGMNCATGGCQ
jgi:hypothetical protein